MPDDIHTQMAAAWREAANKLGIRVTAPFEVAWVSYPAHLPDFGGQKGMVVATLRSPDEVVAAAAAAGLYLSRASDQYGEFEPDLFKATLDDWGWFGPAEDRPAWYTGTAWTT